MVTPVLPVFLRYRLMRGKEDAAHLGERTGHASATRPQGKLVWVHAASVGEANSVLPLIQAILAENISLTVLLTTVTVTSANMMRSRLPLRTVHQFAPVDTPSAVKRFLEHWRPDIALWVDSELWPNIILATREQGAVMGIINARMSQKSFRSWQLAHSLAKDMLSCFRLCFAQSSTDSERLVALGIPAVTAVCNLKYDAPVLPFDDQELIRFKTATAGRKLWIAASTHPGEEKIIADIHQSLKPYIPGLLTVIVPRHAKRGAEIVAQLSGCTIAQRSQGGIMDNTTDIYLADTMGELGLFYRLAPIAFIGGTLVPHGGQNPLEAARIGCAIIAGPHTHNFADMVAAMEKNGAIMRIKKPQELSEALKSLMADEARRNKLSIAALSYVNSTNGAVGTIMNRLRPYLS